MKLLGHLGYNSSSVLIEMSKWEFAELTGINDITHFSPDRNKEYGFLPEVRAALKLLTLKGKLIETSKALEALAALCRTELPLYKEIQDALQKATNDAATPNNESPA